MLSNSDENLEVNIKYYYEIEKMIIKTYSNQSFIKFYFIGWNISFRKK